MLDPGSVISTSEIPYVIKNWNIAVATLSADKSLVGYRPTSLEGRKYLEIEHKKIMTLKNIGDFY